MNTHTTQNDIEIAPHFAAIALASDLADILDRKSASGGRAATRDEKATRTLLVSALVAADLDTIRGGAYTFTIEPETVRLADEDGVSYEAEMVDRLHVHRACKTSRKAAPRASKKVPRSMRSSMVAVLSEEDAPVSCVRAA